MPRFSIITPTRNRPEWLPRCFQSVLDQDHQHWEMIILDNGTLPVEDLVPDDPRFIYHQAECAGVADAYNQAMSLASGEVIHPLSDDDQLAAGALSVVARSLGDALWLVGGTIIHDGSRTLGIRGSDRASLQRTKDGEYWLGGAVYWRRKLTELVGGFNNDYDGAADFDLYLRFAAHSDPVIIPDILYLYTDWAGTDSRMRAANQAAQSARIASTIGG